MKKIRLFVSQNGWEYIGIVDISYENEVLFNNTEDYRDSIGDPTPNVIIVDGVSLEFDEGFEWEELNG